MLLLLVYAAVLLLGLPVTVQGVSTVHVSITTLLTIASCPATVKECSRSNTPPEHWSMLSRSRYSASVIDLMLWNHDKCLQTFHGQKGQQFCSTFMNSFCSDRSGWPGHALHCEGFMASQANSIAESSGLGKFSLFINHFKCMSNAVPDYQSGVLVSTTSSIVSTETGYSTNALPTVSSATQESLATTIRSDDGQSSTSVIQATLEAPDQSYQMSSSVETGISQVIPTTTALVSSGVPFSFTSIFTNEQGSLTTTVIQASLSDSMPVVQPSSFTQSASGVSQSVSSALFSFTSVFTDPQGSLTTTVIQISQPASGTISAPGVSQSQQSSGVSQSQSSTVASFSSTSVLTDQQGTPVTTVIQVSQISQSAQPTPETSQSQSGFETVTLVLTNSQGIPTSTVTRLSQPQPVQNSQSSVSASLRTVTVVLTDQQGNPTTTVTQLSQVTFTVPSSQSVSDISGFPSVTPPPSPTGSVTGVFPSVTAAPASSISCQPFPDCLLSGPLTTDGGPVCSPLPDCIFPRVTGKPTTCSPFPGCLLTVIPGTVQTELASYCDDTPLIDCIFTKPNPTCEKNFPECLLDGGIDPDLW